MEKITKSIEDIIMINKAIDILMRVPGIPYEKTIVFARLWEQIQPLVQDWQETSTRIYMKYAQKLPETPFVPFKKYKEFKENLLALAKDDTKSISLINIEDLMRQYEITSKAVGQYVIPVENKDAYEEIMKTVEIKAAKEIEYEKIDADEEFISKLKYLPGKLQMALNFMIKKQGEPGLVLPFGKGGKILHS